MGDGVEEEEEEEEEEGGDGDGDGDGDDQYSDDGGMNACRVSCMQPADMDGCLHAHTHTHTMTSFRLAVVFVRSWLMSVLG